MDRTKNSANFYNNHISICFSFDPTAAVHHIFLMFQPNAMRLFIVRCQEKVIQLIKRDILQIWWMVNSWVCLWDKSDIIIM